MHKQFKHTHLLRGILLTALVCLSLILPGQAAYGASGKVTGVKVTSLPAKTLTLKKGKSFKLKTKVTGTGSFSKAVTYKSSNPKVVAVSKKGKLTAKKNGKAKITITSKKNRKKKYVIKVTVGKPVKKLTLNQTSASLTTGKSLTLKTTVLPKKASNKKVLWSSGNTAVATVSTSGLVTAKKTGTTTITALAADGSGKKASCKVTVTKRTQLNIGGEVDLAALFQNASSLPLNQTLSGSGNNNSEAVSYYLKAPGTGRYEFIAVDKNGSSLYPDIYDQNQKELDWYDCNYSTGRYVAELTAGKTYFIWFFASQPYSIRVRMLHQVNITFNATDGYFPEYNEQLEDVIKQDAVTIPYMQGDYLYQYAERPSYGNDTRVFAGWADHPGASASECLPVRTMTAENDQTLYAVWAEPVVVRFAANNGVFFYNEKTGSYQAIVSITYPRGLKLSADYPLQYIYFQNPTRSGYQFAGWAATSDAGTNDIINLDQTFADQNIEYYAVWK
ncbi:MAG: Ig-like domain-containing protein [Eubacterium sp.]|nr:Ig-like domain-containing protein [Eubacterium sp.]